MLLQSRQILTRIFSLKVKLKKEKERERDCLTDWIQYTISKFDWLIKSDWLIKTDWLSDWLTKSDWPSWTDCISLYTTKGHTKKIEKFGGFVLHSLTHSPPSCKNYLGQFAKARDQKQLYRLNETMSHSGGGLKYVRLSHSPFSWLFWPPNWPN